MLIILEHLPKCKQIIKFSFGSYRNVIICYIEYGLPHCEKNLTLFHMNNKGGDQPAHPHSLISAFVIHSLENTIDKLATCKISRFLLVYVAEQAG